MQAEIPHPRNKFAEILRKLAGATLLVLLLTGPFALGQNYTVLHAFTGGTDGYYPEGLTLDSVGNIYGATLGSTSGAGGIYKLQARNSGWTLTPIYAFADRNGGQYPNGVVFGPDGRLYGTTLSDGINFFGTVFSLAPSASICHAVLCPWTATQIVRFDLENGARPLNADLVFDGAGNIYGTTSSGGNYLGGCDEYGCGVVYQVHRSNGQWIESVLYQFADGLEMDPLGGVVLDSGGNVYGATYTFDDNGDVYELAAGSWTHSVIHHFSSASDGSLPAAGLLIDANGNLYGTTIAGGSNGGGTVYELSRLLGGWNFQVLYNFMGNASGTSSPLTMDSAGNLYGATRRGGARGLGNVFKLTKTNGAWTYTSLYDFTGSTDGAYPNSKILIDANGNLYGGAQSGGIATLACPNGCGVVFEITR
jgi:uncharacterized repeat protein (TIGR03803 family)